MAEHTVLMHINDAVEVPKAGKSSVDFLIKQDGSMLGTIRIGQGSFQWKMANKAKFKRLSWPDLFEILNK